MKILLADRNGAMINAWKEQFQPDQAEVMETDITTLKVDAIVSPANSFGFMDGGLDYDISQKLGWHIQEELQRRIQALPGRELLVGNALLLETGHADLPYLISAPTMRVPMSFQIPTSVNAYLAMKAILILAKSESRIQSLAIPGLCTGSGKMKPAIAALQMHQAYREIIMEDQPQFSTFRQAQEFHRRLNPEAALI